MLFGSGRAQMATTQPSYLKCYSSPLQVMMQCILPVIANSLYWGDESSGLENIQIIVAYNTLHFFISNNAEVFQYS